MKSDNGRWRWPLQAAVVGGAAFLLGLGLAPERAWANLLFLSFGLATLGLAGVFGIAVQYAGGPRQAPLRRACEALSRVLPYGAAGVLLVLLLHPSTWPWYGDPSLLHGAFKRLWLARGFFLARAVVILGLWLVFRALFVRVASPRRHAILAAGFCYVFAITLAVASFDWLMSLEPGWASTIFAFYHFAGLGAGGVAALILVHLHRHARTGTLAPPEFVHDLGQLLFAFCCLWVYMWFCQYLLIWYVNIPEESSFYARRLAGGWASLYYLGVLLGWGVPFLVLLPGRCKASPADALRGAPPAGAAGPGDGGGGGGGGGDGDS
ncbi:MAG: hypothetical protein HYU66_22300 [Armatimonadetes bacterium]|nr:hypothetical protein [Armatimonadota bacterium]